MTAPMASQGASSGARDSHEASVRALLPAPLVPWGEPLVRFSVHALICDLGHGWAWAQAHPEASQFHESVVGIAAEHAGTIGYWDPFLWTDGDAELPVWVRFAGSEDFRVEDMSALTLRRADGTSVPLLSVVDVDVRPSHSAEEPLRSRS